MAFDFVATAGVGGDLQSYVCDKPTGTAEDDIMFATLFRLNFTAVSSAPSGWTLLASGAPSTLGGAYLYYKVAGGSEPSTYTWTCGTQEKGRVQISTWRGGFDTADPIDAYSNTAYETSDTTLRAASVTASADDTPLLFIGGAYYLATMTFTPPSGYAEEVDTGDAGSDVYYECAWDLVASGATGNLDGTLIAARTTKHAFAVALNPLLYTTYDFTGTGETVTVSTAGGDWDKTKPFTGTGETISVSTGGTSWSLESSYSGSGETISVSCGGGSWEQQYPDRITYRQIVENGGGQFARLWHIAGFPWAVTDSEALIDALSDTDDITVQRARKRLFGENVWTDGATTVTPAYSVPIFPGLMNSFGKLKYESDESNGIIKGGSWSVRIEDRTLGHTWDHAASDDTIWGLDGLHRTARVKESSVHGWGYLGENMLRNVGGSNPQDVDIQEQSNSKIFSRIAGLAEGEWLTLWLNQECFAVNSKTGTWPDYSVGFAGAGVAGDWGRGLYRSSKQDHFTYAIAGLDPIVADVPPSAIGRHCWLYTIPLKDGSLMLYGENQPMIVEEARGIISPNVTTEGSVTSVSIREDLSALQRTKSIEMIRDLETNMAGFLFSRGAGGTTYDSVMKNWQMPHLVIFEYDGGPDGDFLLSDNSLDLSNWNERYIWICPSGSNKFLDTAEDVMVALENELQKLMSGDNTAFSWPSTGTPGQSVLSQKYKIDRIKDPVTGEILRYRLASYIINGSDELVFTSNSDLINPLCPAPNITGPLAWVFSLGSPFNEDTNIYTKIRNNQLSYYLLETSNTNTLNLAGSVASNRYSMEENWMFLNRTVQTSIDRLGEYLGLSNNDRVTMTSFGSMIPRYYYSWPWADNTPTARVRYDIYPSNAFTSFSPPKYPDDNTARIFLPEGTDTNAFPVGDTLFLGTDYSRFPQLSGTISAVEDDLEGTNLVSVTVSGGGFSVESGDTICMGTSLFYLQNAELWGRDYNAEKYLDPHYVNKGVSITTTEISDVFSALLGNTAVSGVNIAKEIQYTDCPFFSYSDRFTDAINWSQLDDIEKIGGQFYDVNINSRTNMLNILKNELLMHRCVMTRYFDDTNLMWRYGFREIAPINASMAINSGYLLDADKCQNGAPVEWHGNTDIYNRIQFKIRNDTYIFEKQNASVVGNDAVRTLEITPEISRFPSGIYNSKEISVNATNVTRYYIYNAFLPFLDAISYPSIVHTKKTGLLQYLFPTGKEIVVDDDSARMPYTHAPGIDNAPAIVVGYVWDIANNEGEIEYRLGGGGESFVLGYAPSCKLSTGNFTKDVGSWEGTPDDHAFTSSSQPNDAFFFDCYNFIEDSAPTARTSCGCGDYAVYAIELGTNNWTPLPFTCSVDSTGYMTLTGTTTNIDTDKDYVIVFQGYDSCESCQRWYCFHADDNNTIGASSVTARRWI